MRIVQRNVRAIGGDGKKTANWISWMSRNPGDIKVLIDTRMARETESFLKSRWRGPIFFHTLSSNTRGTAILTRKGSNITNCDFKIIDTGNFSTLHYKYEKKSMC